MDDQRKPIRDALRTGFQKYCRGQPSKSILQRQPVVHTLGSGWHIDDALLDAMAAELRAAGCVVDRDAEKHRDRVRVRLVLHKLGFVHTALDDKIDEIIVEIDETIATAMTSEGST